MPKLYTKTYYDYHEVADEVETNLGKPLRNYIGDNYQDFWHELIDYTDLGRGQIVSIDFDEMAESSSAEWVKEICAEFVKVLGEGEHDFYFDW